MRPVYEWKRILKRSWSIRLALLAGLLTGAEAIVPLFFDSMPRNIFAALSFFVSAAAIVARIVAQPAMHNPNES